MPSWMKWAIAVLIGAGVITVGFRFAGWLLNVFFILNCFVLVIVVLLQSGKAADLAGAFGGAGSQTAFGPRGAANVLSKATTWCAIMFMLCSMALVLRTDKAVEQGGSVLEKFSKPAPKPAPATTPATTPAAPQPTHDSLPTGQQPASQAPAATPQSNAPAPPASQTPAGQQPSPQAPAKPQSSTRQTGQSPAQPPASSQPAAPAKKP